MTTIPSNLIPTRITELPEYGGTDTSGLVTYVLGGRTYRAQFGQFLGFDNRADTVEVYNSLAAGADCRAALRSTLDAMPRAYFYRSEYNIGAVPADERSHYTGLPPCIVIGPDVSLIDGRGVTLTPTEACKVFQGSLSAWPGSTPTVNVTADMAAGARVFPVASASTFAVGENVLWHLGELSFDKPETDNWGFGKVVSVDTVSSPNTVTLDAPIRKAFTVASVTTGNKLLRRLPDAQPLTVRDIHIAGAEGLVTEYGLMCRYRKNVRVERLTGDWISTGIVMLQNVDGAVISECGVDSYNDVAGGDACAFACAETWNTHFQNCWAKNIPYGIKAEAGAQLTADGFRYENTYTGGAVPRNTVYLINGRARLTASNTMVTGAGGAELVNASNGISGWGGDVTLRDTYIYTDGEMYSMPLWKMNGALIYDIAGSNEIYNLDEPVIWRTRVAYSAAGTFAVYGPPGLLVSMQVYASPALTLGTGNILEKFQVGRSGANGSDLVAGLDGEALAAGEWSRYRFYGGVIDGTWSRRAQQVQLRSVVTGSPVAADHYVDVVMTIVPEKTVLGWPG